MQSQFNSGAVFRSYPTGSYMGVPPQPPRGHFRMQSTINRPPQQYTHLPHSTYSHFAPTNPNSTAPIRVAPSAHPNTLPSQESYSHAVGRDSMHQTAPRRGILRSSARQGSISDGRSQRHVKFSEDVTCIQHEQLKGDGTGSRPKQNRELRQGVASRVNEQGHVKYDAMAGATSIPYNNVSGRSYHKGRENHSPQDRTRERHSGRVSMSNEAKTTRYDHYSGNSWPHHRATTHPIEDDRESMVTHRGGRKRSQPTSSASRSARRPFIVEEPHKEATRLRRNPEPILERSGNGSGDVGERLTYMGQKIHNAYEGSTNRMTRSGSRKDRAAAPTQLESSRYQPTGRGLTRERTRYY